ncbi:Trans-Golgi network-localized SYP41-interacting protein 1 [Linum perenne]
MEKNKNRTDLLAAGRKKLQQYRQKKDGKGSSSNAKSGKKSGKSEPREADCDMTSMSAGLRQVLEDENMSHVDSSSANLDSLGNSVATSDDVPDVSQSPVSSLHESENDQLLSGHMPEFSSPYVSVLSNDTDHTESNQSTINAIEESYIPHVIPGIQDPEVESEIYSTPVMAETDIPNIEVNKELLQSEVLSAVPLVLDGEPQVSDEADGLVSRQLDCDHGIDPKRDGEHNASEYGDFSEMVKETTELDVGVDHTSMTPEQISDEASALPPRVEASDLLVKSIVATSGEYGTFTGSNESMNQEGVIIEASSMMGKSVESMRASDIHPTSFAVGTTPINIVQLLEVIKGLNEDDYGHLIKSRGLPSDVKLGTDTLPHGYHDWLEKLSEELFVASCTRDILHLQLSDQLDLQKMNDFQSSQLNEDMSRLKDSLKDARDKNANLVQDLIACRSGYLDAIANKEELQSQLQISKADVDEVSTRAYELQNSLESSQSDLFSVSKELVHWKELVESLKVENNKLNEALALGADERMKLKDQNECCLHENDELSKELDKFKVMTATLQREISDLSGNFVSLTKDKEKLEEENKWLTNGNQKLSSEFSDFKDLMDALKVENAVLNENLVLMKENHKNLEDENMNLIHEKERIMSELLGLRETLSNHQAEHVQFEADMQKMETRLEQLTMENIGLHSSLDACKAKIGYVDEMQPQNLPPDEVAVVQSGAMMIERTDFIDVAENEHSHSFSGNQEGRKQISGALEGSSLADVFAHESPDNTHGFVSFNAHLEEAEEAFHNLEKVIALMCGHLASSGKSGGKVSSPAVSKLIQAFETKSQHEEQEMDDQDVMQGQSVEGDLFISTKECTENLKTVLKQLSLDAEQASLVYKAAQDGLTTANVTISDLKFQLETLAQHNDNSEMTNIEQKVYHEGLKQHLLVMEEKNIELEVIFEKLRQENNSIKTENSELHEKMDLYKKRIKEIHGQFHELRDSSNEVTPDIHSQLKSFQKDIVECALILEQEWKSSFTQISEAVERLDHSVGVVQTSRLSAGKDGPLDITSWLGSSVDAAVKMTWHLKEEIEAANAGQESTSKMLSEANMKYDELLQTNKAANDLLHELYSELKKLLSDLVHSLPNDETNIHNEELLDHTHYKSYQALLEQLRNILEERQQLHAANKELNLELLNKTKDVEDLSRQSVDLSSIAKLIIDLEGLVKQDDALVDSEMNPVSRLESLVYFLTEKNKEAGQLGLLSREQSESKLLELDELHEKISQISSLKLEHENEIQILKEQLSQVNEALNAAHSNLKEKTTELEQSEQRVSSVREKLSMAVAKGKGLIVQRDSLKQSLAETSNELDRCSQELELKDARLHELETELKNYSEAAERAEALESELSYIRNSATAIRESFLLKDSVLQKIEEILEDLDLPVHVHSRDIIDKVDWLARTASGTSVSPTDWEQTRSVGASPSDTAFTTETWKEEVQMSSSSVDDLRRKCEELQGKFYGLAEQNEMLEQSLLERNQLVQRWEELLNVIDLPLHLRSLEPEDKIEWIGSALLESNQDRNYLQQKVDNLESSCATLTADLEDSSKRITHLAADLEELQKRTSGLETDLQAVTRERDNLSEESVTLAHDNQQLLEKTVKFELDNEKLLHELTGLREKLVEKEGYEYQIQHINDEIVKLQDLVCNALPDSGATDLVGGDSGTECLEGLLRKLIENYATHSASISSEGIVTVQENSGTADAAFDEGRSRDGVVTEHSDVRELDAVDARELRCEAVMKELEEISSELEHVKEERDQYKNKQESLSSEVEVLDKKRVVLQELLIQEEQKSASAKEKLNIAVRKGKSLLQQRDSLKQNIEELNVEMQHLKSEIKHRESTLENYEKKITELSSTYSVRVEALESESLFFQNRLADILRNIDLGVEMKNIDSFEKLEQIPRIYQEMHAALASSEQESAKSRRAAELLLAELNEVQERNDVLQEELSKVTFEFSELSKLRDLLEDAKFEAVSRIQELSTTYTEEKKKQHSELIVLISSTNQLRKIFSDINNQVFGHLSKDAEFTKNIEASVESLLQISEVSDLHQVPFFSNSNDTNFVASVNKDNFLHVEPSSKANTPDNFDANVVIGEVCNSLQECTKEAVALKMRMQDHSFAKHEQVEKLSKHIHSVQKVIVHDRQSIDTLKSDLEHLEAIVKQKETEAAVLQTNLFSLYETCINSLKEIGTKNAEIMGNTMVPRDLMGPGLMDGYGLPSSGNNHSLSEEHVKKMSDTLMMAVKDFISLKRENFDGDRKELKLTIASLQKELQEKDIQRESICMELVGQIKEAEAVATRSSLDFQSAKSRLQDLEKLVEVAMEERKLLEEQKSNELEDERKVSLELSDQIRSLSDTIASKDQEIEALTQALDEEESQMEDLTRKVEELEKALLQKNLDIENLEASRGKVQKKLLITKSKFDELHQFSESLLVEIEKLRSQLQDRDADISFLRQEVTRCTNDVLVASQTSDKKNVDEIHELFSWLINLVPQLQTEASLAEDGPVHDHKEALQKKIAYVVSELENQRVAAQTKDTLLQIELNKVEDLSRREEILEKSLREKESQLNMLEGVEDVTGPINADSEIVETEPVMNKWTVPGAASTSKVRSLRKVNNDQVAIAIDTDEGGSRLEDEDDDKVHGFKSLTTSRIVPKFTRPVSDMIDGLWVSCDRTLMRQPAFRLGIMMYWAVMHLLLAAFIF